MEGVGSRAWEEGPRGEGQGEACRVSHTYQDRDSADATTASVSPSPSMSAPVIEEAAVTEARGRATNVVAPLSCPFANLQLNQHVRQ